MYNTYYLYYIPIREQVVYYIIYTREFAWTNLTFTRPRLFPRHLYSIQFCGVLWTRYCVILCYKFIVRKTWYALGRTMLHNKSDYISVSGT